MKRSSPLRRTAPMTRGQIRFANPKRRRSEFARCYGSKARVAFVKALPCVAFGCMKSPCDNAHSVTGGMGRKADFDTVVPLCREHHRAYDQHLYPFDIPSSREWVQRKAVVVEQMWQSHTNPEHIGSVVARVMDRIA